MATFGSPVKCAARASRIGMILGSFVLGSVLGSNHASAGGIALSYGSCLGGGGSYYYPLVSWQSSTYNVYSDPNCWRYLSVDYVDAGSPQTWYGSGYYNQSWYLSDNGDRFGCDAFHMLGLDNGSTTCTVS
jgi:hypothetical protein